MDQIERRAGLIRGIVLALIPAILFLPVVAMLTICPHDYAQYVLLPIMVAFSISEVVAGWQLSHVLKNKFDLLSVGAVAGLLVGALVLAAIVWGYIPWH
jgi:uncharacterized membrane protein YfcA